ncbi:MAG: DUF4097 family beta strand repeat protein [Acidobacteria bacterium]|nr:DUF4097 family beta strand repeat protein [Acidobacteriota bacterium]
MNTFVAAIASLVTMLPAVGQAQAPDHDVKLREAVRVIQQTPVERRTQERVRQSAERAREERQRERERAQERANQYRREYRDEQTEKISRTLKIGANGELDISNLSGDIIVTRGGGDDVRIDALKVARGRTVEDAREMLSYVTLDFTERGSRAEVKTVYRNHEERSRTHRSLNVSVQYAVTAPEHVRISARSLSGNIQVTGIKGDLNLVSLSGNVSISQGARVMLAKSTSGEVEIMDLRSEVPLEAHTTSGGVVIRQSRAPRMELNSVSGNLIVTDVDCPRIEAQTLSGNVELNSPLSKNGRYELTSHSGEIRIKPSGNTGFELDANSFSGNIQSDLTLKEQRQGGADDSRRGQGGRTRTLRGVYGDGSATLDITTFSGSVVIGKK